MKRLNRKLDTSPEEVEKNEREIKGREFNAGIKKRKEAVRYLRKASEEMTGLKLYNKRLGAHLSWVSILADFIEGDIKQLKEMWPHEPTDLRDDWHHAKPVLREAARYVPPYMAVNEESNTYTTVDLRNTTL